jgi:hypothetical protein
MRSRTLALLIFGFLISALSGQAQVNRVAQSGMTFLAIDVGARPVAMGGSFICMDGDANALFWNPAGIARIRGIEFVLNETSWFADMKEYSLGLTYSMGKYGVVGLGFLIMDNPDVHVTTIRYAGGEKWEDQGFQDIIDQHVLGISYARQITDRFSVGGQVKWVHEDLGTWEYEPRAEGDLDSSFVAKKNVLAYDFGTQYYAGFRDLRVALSIRNFAPRTRYQLEYFELPLIFSLGMAMDVLSIFMPDDKVHSLTLSVDAIHPRDYSERVQIGGEYWFADMVALRAGYKFNHDLESFAGGIGVKKSLGTCTVRVDYSYSQFGGIFDDVHRLSFGFSR